MKIKSMRKIECCSTADASCCVPKPRTIDNPPCCGPVATCSGGEISDKVPGFVSWLSTAAGNVPQISTTLTLRDHIGACKARWALNRMNYIVPAGLYAIGTPTAYDPVAVTCNYKMTYDIVRRELSGRNVWLLVLETFGVNVWCAAGKGTFGTDELVKRIDVSGVSKVVSHRRLLLPILGAPGIAAHEVARRTGFSISYATIRANDLPEFLDNNMVTTSGMRELTFTLYERMILVPVELLIALRSAVVVALVVLLLGLLFGGIHAGTSLCLAYLGAMLTGVVAGPILLPWLPGRSFATKGAIVGLLWSAAWYLISGGSGWNLTAAIAAFLVLPAVSAFYTLNFTGCSTYTSRTGVKKEMRLSLPAMGGAIAVGVLVLLVGRFI